LEELRRIARAGVGKRGGWNIIQEAPLSLWANFRQRALDIAILEINKKTGVSISAFSGRTV
jgi:hypothetical protein